MQKSDLVKIAIYLIRKKDCFMHEYLLKLGPVFNGQTSPFIVCKGSLDVSLYKIILHNTITNNQYI